MMCVSFCTDDLAGKKARDDRVLARRFTLSQNGYGDRTVRGMSPGAMCLALSSDRS